MEVMSDPFRCESEVGMAPCGNARSILHPCEMTLRLLQANCMRRQPECGACCIVECIVKSFGDACHGLQRK